MMDMGKSRKHKITELTPEALNSLNQETLVGVIMQLYEQNKQLSEQLRSLITEKYGRKTEKFVDPDQLRFFSSEAENSELSSNQNSEQSTVEPHKQSSSNNSKIGHSRNPMPSGLNRVPITGKEPSAEQLMCRCCSIPRIKVNQIIRNSRLEYKPASLFVEDFVDSVFACPQCGDSFVVEPELPESIKNGTAGPGLQSEIAVSKYEDHTPLHRQEQRFARMGISISRSTMCGWLASSVSVVRPIYNRMRVLLLQSEVIATDDTPVKVQDRSKQANIKRGCFWIYRGDDLHPFNLFDYTEGRARAGPKTFLAGWRGYLQGDCFSGNQALCTETGAVHVACGAHARRYFFKAQSNNKAGSNEALRIFQELFKIESDARELGLSAEDIKLMREQESKPVLAEMKTWLDQQSLVALPQSAFGKAVQYCLRNWTELNNYLLDGRLRFDNNLAEQEMKRVAIGRKNWLFLGSDNGGEQAEVLMSIMSTCRRHGVEPWSYLKDVIQRLTENPNAQLDELLPNNWKQTNPATEIRGSAGTPQMASAS